MSANVKVVEGDVEMSRDRSSLPTLEAIDCPQNSEISSKIAGKALEESVDQNSSLTKEHTRGIVDVLPSEPPDKSFEASDKLEPEEDAHRYNGGTIRMTAHEAGGAKKRNRPKQKIVVSSLQNAFQPVGEDSAGKKYWFDGEKSLYESSSALHPNGLAEEVTLVCKSVRQWTSKYKELLQQSHPKDTQLAQLIKNHFLPLVKKAISQKDKAVMKLSEANEQPTQAVSATSSASDSGKVSEGKPQVPSFHQLQHPLMANPQNYCYVIPTPLGPQVVMNSQAAGQSLPHQVSSHPSLTMASQQSSSASVSSGRNTEHKLSASTSDILASAHSTKSLPTDVPPKGTPLSSPPVSLASQTPQTLYYPPSAPYSVHKDPKSGQSYFLSNQGQIMGQPYTLMQLPDGRYVQVPSSLPPYHLQQQMHSQKYLYQAQAKSMQPPLSESSAVGSKTSTVSEAEDSRRTSFDVVEPSKSANEELKNTKGVHESVFLPELASDVPKCFRVPLQEHMGEINSCERCSIVKEVNAAYSSMQQSTRNESTKPDGNVGVGFEASVVQSSSKPQVALPSKHRRKKNPIKSHSPSPEVFLPLDKEDRKKLSESQLALVENKLQVSKDVENEKSFLPQGDCSPDVASPVMRLKSSRDGSVNDLPGELVEREEANFEASKPVVPEKSANDQGSTHHSKDGGQLGENEDQRPISATESEGAIEGQLMVSIERRLYDLIHQTHKERPVVSPVHSDGSSANISDCEAVPSVNKVDSDTARVIAMFAEPNRAKRRCVAAREEMQKLQKMFGQPKNKKKVRRRAPSRRSVRLLQEKPAKYEDDGNSSPERDEKASQKDNDSDAEEEEDTEEYDMDAVYVFSSQMANHAAKAVADGRYYSITKWHASQSLDSIYLKTATTSPSNGSESIAAKFSNKLYSSSFHVDSASQASSVKHGEGESDVESSKKSTSSDDDDSSDGESESDQETPNKDEAVREEKDSEVFSPTKQYGAKQLLFAAEGRIGRINSKAEGPADSLPDDMEPSHVSAPQLSPDDSKSKAAAPECTTVGKLSTSSTEDLPASGIATEEKGRKTQEENSVLKATNEAHSPNNGTSDQVQVTLIARTSTVGPLVTEPSASTSHHVSSLPSMLPQATLSSTSGVFPVLPSSPYMGESLRSQQPFQIGPVHMRPNPNVPIGPNPYVSIPQFPYPPHPRSSFHPQYHADQQAFRTVHHGMPPVQRVHDPNWMYSQQLRPPYISSMHKTLNSSQSTSRTS
jgi:hypothetical protein